MSLEDARQHLGREKTAWKTSGPWFLAGLGLFAVALVLAAVAGAVVGGIALVIGLVVFSLAGHKHGKAGGHDAGYMY